MVSFGVQKDLRSCVTQPWDCWRRQGFRGLVGCERKYAASWHVDDKQAIRQLKLTSLHGCIDTQFSCLIMCLNGVCFPAMNQALDWEKRPIPAIRGPAVALATIIASGHRLSFVCLWQCDLQSVGGSAVALATMVASVDGPWHCDLQLVPRLSPLACLVSCFCDLHRRKLCCSPLLLWFAL